MFRILSVFSSSNLSIRRNKGFTIVELMVSIAVVAILSAIALPNMNEFLVKMRVDNQISELQRLLLTARNMAINTGRNTTVCPLNGNSCSNNWQNTISVFTNDSNAIATNNTYAAPDELIKTKEAISTGDKLQSTENSIIYAPDGRLITTAANFSFCPKDKADLSRGIVISISGRSYPSSDIDSDGKDEDRAGNEIVCT